MYFLHFLKTQEWFISTHSVLQFFHWNISSVILWSSYLRLLQHHLFRSRANCLVLSVRPNLFLLQSRSLSGRHLSASFLDPVLGAMMNQVCRQTLKSLASECRAGVRLRQLNFLTPLCVDWLFWLLAFGEVQVAFVWTDVVDTLPGSGSAGSCLRKSVFANPVELSLFPPCFDHFFGPCFAGHDEQVYGHSRRSEAPRTQTVLAWGQSEAYGDPNLFYIVVAVP